MEPLVSQQMRTSPRLRSRMSSEARRAKGIWAEGSPPNQQTQPVVSSAASARSRGACAGARQAVSMRYCAFWQNRQSKVQAPRKTARLFLPLSPFPAHTQSATQLVGRGS